MRAVLLCSVIAGLGWQTPARDAAGSLPAGTATISGVVITADTPGRPIRRVTLTLSGGDTAPLMAITDDSGRFAFRALPAGRYTLAAERPGYVRTWYGATRPNRLGTAIAVADGQQVANISVRMLRGAVITGTLTTETGEPARDARVSVMAFGNSYFTGERTLVSAGISPVGQLVDDRGAYRIYGLAPGDYVIAATIPSRGAGARQTTEADYQRAMQLIRGSGAAVPPAPTAPESTMGSAPIFFPGTISATSAQAVTVRAAEERSGINFSVHSVPAGRIQGLVNGPDGQPMAGILVLLVDPMRVPGMLMSPLTTRATSDRDGRFTFNSVTPGSYSLVSRANASGTTFGRGTPAAPGVAPALWAMTEVTTDGRDTPATLNLRPGVNVSGKLAFDTGGTPVPADLTRARVTLQAIVTSASTALSVPPVSPDATGAFSFAGVTPGRYRLNITVPGGPPASPTWLMKSATTNGLNLLDNPLEVASDDVAGVEVTMTDRPTELAGMMQDAAGKPAPEYYLIAFPQNTAQWVPQSLRIQQVRPAADGKFLFRGLPPGDYFLGGVVDVQPGEWYDRTFLQQLTATAIRLTLAEGEKKTQNIQVK
jgi:hypothetical protein